MAYLGFQLQELTKWCARRCSYAIALTGLGLLALTRPTLGAEEIIITYGFFERTVSIKDLAALAKGQELSPQLAQYAKSFQLSESDLENLRQILNDQVDFNEVELAQFLYTTQGETLLNTLGEVIQTPSRQSGSRAMRAALILAAADEETGLTLLNFLVKYPTPGIRVDVSRGLEIAETITDTISKAERAISLVRDLAETEAQLPGDDLLQLRFRIDGPDPYGVTTRPLTIQSRDIEAILYLPQAISQQRALPENIPVIVISHGLGDEQLSYAYLAEHLARRGFFVATLNHPGSDIDQISALLSGLSPQVVENQEFLNRPKDVSALLDAIQQFASGDSTFQRRLNIQNVGVIGQSFGGYTALALAGATFDAETLIDACGPRPIYLNPSLLLQCQAIDITAAPSGKDDRVKAIFVVNPVGSRIFGKSGYAQLEVPVMIMSATADTVAPALPEQIEPFTWLQTRYRYLALVNETTHFSVIAANTKADSSILVPSTFRGSSPDIAQRYLRTLSLAFFQRHLKADVQYDDALTARYAKQHIEQWPLQPLSLIQNLTPEALTQAITTAEN